MITQEQRDWLAVEIMGWTEHFAELKSVPNQYSEKGAGVCHIDVMDWQPDTNIEQAVDLLIDYSSVQISRSTIPSSKWMCVISGVYESDDKSLPLAICKAVLKASGYKES